LLQIRNFLSRSLLLTSHCQMNGHLGMSRVQLVVIRSPARDKRIVSALMIGREKKKQKKN
jgi:hypothetical protein